MHFWCRRILLLSVCILLSFSGKAEDTVRRIRDKKAEKWVDSIYSCMNTRERIGQLFMVDVYSNLDTNHFKKIEELISKYHIGGLIFMQGGPRKQVFLTNKFQQLTELPLLIGMDAEWGLRMRLDSTLAFPQHMTMGALDNAKLVYDIGIEIGKQCKRLGVHINFGPVVDVNSNSQNPIIGVRSFGEDKYNVLAKSLQYMKGLQSQKILACAKHFPGHGDTDLDSHLTLPTISNSKKYIDDIDLYPYKKLIDDTLACIMTAHISVPSIESNAKIPASLSYKVVSKLLKDKMNFKGLVFSDALNMGAVSNLYEPGVLEKNAFMAGNDVLLFSQNIPKAFEVIENSLLSKEIDYDRLEESVKKILFKKYKLGLNRKVQIDTAHLISDLNNRKAKSLIEKTYRNAITVVKNEKLILPIKNTLSKTACILVGFTDENKDVENIFKKYSDITIVSLPKKTQTSEFENYFKKYSSYDNVVFMLGGDQVYLKDKIANNIELLAFIQRLNRETNVIVSVLGSPYILDKFENFNTIICGYEDNSIVRKTIPQIIYGGLSNEATLPVSPSEKFNKSVIPAKFTASRLSYVENPETKGLNSVRLSYIDSIVNQSISKKYFPGCQVLVVKDSSVVYNKSFGYHRYSTYSPVTDTTIYDIASLTKVSSTLQATMSLYSQNKIDLTLPLSSYLQETSCTNKANLFLQEILVHQAGLQAFIMHWVKTKETPDKLKYYYSTKQDSVYSVAIADSLYTRPSTKDSIWKWTLQSKLMHKIDSCYSYKYSDIGFYIFQKITEQLTGKSLMQYTDSLYNELGMTRSGYLPLRKYSKNNIAPSTIDKVFRNREIWGYVNDEGAAMYGGVAGHAGVFSTSNDLAKLFQMNLQNGYYGYKRYYNEQVIDFFRTRHYIHNRRGLGWDKPEWNGGGTTSIHASQKTFGHTGFTGTCVWIDPKYNLIYIFLSNRTYPDSENKGLIVHNIRTRIHDIIYESFLK